MIDIKTDREIVNSSFRNELIELLQITMSLKKIGKRILNLLLSSFGIIASYVFVKELTKSDQKLIDFVAFIILIMIGTGLYNLMHFTRLSKKGWDIYEHITDEIDWSNKRKTYIHKPPTETKIVIRDFLRSTDLPFTKSSVGIAFYLSFYVIQFVLSLLLLYFEMRRH